MSKTVIFSTLFFFLTGCSTTMSLEASKVRKIEASFTNSCHFIATDSVSDRMGLGKSGTKRNAITKMKNSVASHNGNAYVITDVFNNPTYEIDFEIYKCNHFK